MKKLLLSVLLSAGYIVANTCTEAWFKINSNISWVNKQEPHLDSIYNKNGDTESIHKYFYRNGNVDSLAIIPKNEGGEIEEYKFYFNVNSEDIPKTGRTNFISGGNSSDGVKYFTEIPYVDETMQHRFDFKISDSYFSSTENISFRDTKTIEYFFREDTLVYKTTIEKKMILDAGYPDNTNQKLVIDLYYLGDSQDDFKCYAYLSNAIHDTLIYNKTANGYSVKVINEGSFAEYFMVTPDGTTAIHKRRTPVRISPKARYFDLLGRYKFTK